jgi:hypothetical protein
MTTTTFFGRGYPALVWCWTALWIAAFIWTWRRYHELALWLKIVISAALILTTPNRGDLLLIRQYWRKQERRDNEERTHV